MLSSAAFEHLCLLYNVPPELNIDATAMYDGYEVGGAGEFPSKFYFHLDSITKLLDAHQAGKLGKSTTGFSPPLQNYMENEKTLAGYEEYFANEQVQDKLRVIANGYGRIEVSRWVHFF